MNKNLIRLGAGFVILCGLAYLGHEVFVQPAGDVEGARAESATAGPLGGRRGYVVYPDRNTEKELKLDYPTFAGNFADNVTVTPLPPHFPGKVLLRMLPGKAKEIEISLTDLQCVGPVHVALLRINDRAPVATGVLDPKQAKLSVPFSDGQVPAMLAELYMDEKAENNYWCGVALRWVQ
ncbi:MAG: hypothetical protein AB1670_16780 [Pseudomonadota bacterium]